MKWFKKWWCNEFHIQYHVAVQFTGKVFGFRCAKCKREWLE
jgi:hypothetical protein